MFLDIKILNILILLLILGCIIYCIVIDRMYKKKY